MSWHKISTWWNARAALVVVALGGALVCGPVSLAMTSAATTTTPASSTPDSASAAPARSSTVSGSAVGAQPSPTPQVVMFTCEHRPVTAPSSVVLTCADGGIQLAGLRWSGWGEATAYATGSLLENTCTPDCADGSIVSYPASVTVTGISGGHYTRLHVDAPQAPGGPYDYTLDAEGPA